MARPPNWASKISAPPEAMEFYELIQKLQSSQAFRDCHIFEGANLLHTGYVSWHNKVQPLPKILLGFLSMPYGKSICRQSGCVNPLHYVADANFAPVLAGLEPPPQEVLREQPLEDFIELIEHYIDQHDLSGQPDFATLRPLIPVEDLSDELLNLSIEKMNHGKL